MTTNNPLQSRLAALLSVLVIALTLTHASAANLLVDGGFELGQEPGTIRQSTTYGAWTAIGATGPYLYGMPVFGIPAMQGSNAMHIGNNRQPGIVRQSFATTIGRRYVVSLWVVGWPGEAGNGTIRVYNSGQTDLLSPFSSSGRDLWFGNPWGQNEFTFTASGSETTLELRNVPPRRNDHRSRHGDAVGRARFATDAGD